MQIAPVSHNLLPARAAAPERPGAGRPVDRVTELLAHTRPHGGQERVLQGELLQGGREPEPPSSRRPETYDGRREDHPAFYRRHSNQQFVQRRALAAYQAYSNPDATTASGRGVDYFI